MAHIHVPAKVPVRYLPRSATANMVFGIMVVVGLVSFVIRLGQDPTQAWISYVSNWLFFTSISVGGVIFAVATWLTKAKWNWSLRRVSQSLVSFLPFSFLLLLPMLTLREGYFHWITEMAGDPILQAKSAYLNIPFLLARNVVGAAVLFGLLLYFVYLAIRADVGHTKGAEHGDEARASWRKRLTQGWAGQAEEEVKSYHRMTTVGPPIVLVFALVMSIFSYDWAMGLEPHWFSTMFGPWFFMGGFWGGIASTVLWAMYARTTDKDIANHIGLQQRHDIGKLLFAFTVFWTYLFFSQYIVIWYGKLPWEQAWIITRSAPPWGKYSLMVIFLCFIIPFAGLIGRKPKMNPRILGTFAAVVLTGLWFERYGLIAPSLYHEGDPIFSIWQPLIGLMFLGLWMGSIRWFLTTFPVLQVWQPMVDPETTDAEIRVDEDRGYAAG